MLGYLSCSSLVVIRLCSFIKNTLESVDKNPNYFNKNPKSKSSLCFQTATKCHRWCCPKMSHPWGTVMREMTLLILPSSLSSLLNLLIIRNLYFY